MAEKPKAPPKPSGATPTSGIDLMALLQQAAQLAGVSPAGLQGTGAGPGYDPRDPPVFVGSEPIERRPVRDERRTVVRPVVVGQRDVTAPSSTLYLAPYKWDRDRLIQFQRQAAAAGLLDNPIYGFPDAATLKLWRGIVDTAADWYTTGRRVTPDDVAAELFTAAGAAGAGGGGRGGGPALPHPLDVEANLRESARRLGAGRLSESEAAALRARYEASARAAGVAPSVGAFAEAELRRAKPVETSANDLLGAIEAFLRLAREGLGGGGG
jgi:hypothetical protein